MTEPARIEWRGVRRVHPGGRRRQPVTALDELDLVAVAGELLVLVGPSGSGKSTALRAVAGIEEIQGGRILLGDRDVTDDAPHRRDVALVFQDLALFPHLTVAQNVLFGPALRALPATAQTDRLTTVSQRLDLEGLWDRRPDELSGGQRQRVALARAMVREPAAFLLDEPLANLDARLRIDARAEIVALQRGLGTTTVFVTHDQAEAMTMGDRIAVLRDGRLEQVGTPREIYDRPDSVFVATFIGSPPMTLLPGDTPLLPLARDHLVGVRAEDLTLHPGGTHQAAALEGRVAVREDLGSEVLIGVDTGVGRVWVRRGPDDRTAVDEFVGVTLVPGGRTHVFQAHSGRRVPDDGQDGR